MNDEEQDQDGSQEEAEGLSQSAKELLAELTQGSNQDTEMSGEERAQWAMRMSDKVDEVLNDPTLTGTARELMETIIEESHLQASLSGMVFSTWLPPGVWRKGILLCLLGVSGVFLVNGGWISASVCIVVAGSFSPRATGEALIWAGTASRYKWPIIIALGILIISFVWVND